MIHQGNTFPTILATATKGTNSNEEERLCELLRNFSVTVFPFNRQAKLRSLWELLMTIYKGRPELMVMEGTGVAGGLAIMLGRLIAQVPYVVSSGDAVGPFVAAQYPIMGLIFGMYERLLCRYSSGLIGWTPYLAGRALTFGAPRAITAAGWAPYLRSEEEIVADRKKIRRDLGIPDSAIVFGIAGSLAWTKRFGYCYGYELVQALLRVNRPEIRVLIVGAGEGLARLKQFAAIRLNETLFFTGQVPQNQVPSYLAAMDVASLPQSVDKIGSFRYTTKLSEYLALGLPVVTGQIPLAYDMSGDWLWRLSGDTPWGEEYIENLACLMKTLTISDIGAKKEAVPRNYHEFDREQQVARVTMFIEDLLKRQKP